MAVFRKIVIGVLLLMPVISLNAFYLPGINVTPTGTFYSGYSSGFGGYVGTSFLFPRVLPHTDLTLGFISTLPGRSSLRQTNLGILGLTSRFNLIGGSVEIRMLYQAPISSSFLLGNSDRWFRKF